MLVVMNPLPATQSSHIFILKRKTFSSAFNSISSMKQIALDFLTNRPQTVQIGNQRSSTLVLNTGAPPLLCAQAPPVHAIHPWLNSQTSGELYCQTRGKLNHHWRHYKQEQVHIRKKSQITKISIQFVIFVDMRWPVFLNHVSSGQTKRAC